MGEKIREKIIEAGRALKTILINYTEADGSNEGSREVEPYSFRVKNGTEYFFGYDIRKAGTRSFIVSNINSVEITENTYNPQWPVEF